MIPFDRPLVWAVPLSALAMLLLLPKGTSRQRAAGSIAGLASLACYAAAFPIPGLPIDRIVFWLLTAIAVGGAAASVSMRSAVYAAIWFAISLLGVAGLFLYQGAQFLSVVTIVVYAGAIVVTFLFVIMLAQSEGGAVYDRITWGREAKLLGVGTGALLIGLLTHAFTTSPRENDRTRVAQVVAEWQARAPTGTERTDGSAIEEYIVDVRASDRGLKVILRNDLPPSDLHRLRIALPRELEDSQPALAAAARKQLDIEFLPAEDNTLHADHMALLGRSLFSRYLVAVEIGGTILLAALVGAVAIAIQGGAARHATEGDAS